VLVPVIGAVQRVVRQPGASPARESGPR
jgi:hypothetical protein